MKQFNPYENTTEHPDHQKSEEGSLEKKEDKDNKTPEETLLEDGVVTSCEYYSGTVDFREMSVEHLPKHAQDYVKILVEILYNPILKDSVEDIIDENGVHVPGLRAHIKTKLKEKGNMDLYQFYASNRLEASNISNTFNLMEFIAAEVPFSDELKNKIKDALSLFSDPDGHELNSERYHHMTNQEKYAFVQGTMTHLLEFALNEFLAPKALVE